MKEYFYLEGAERKGPFTAEELVEKGVVNDTLVWAEGMEKWKKTEEIPELIKILKYKKSLNSFPNEQSSSKKIRILTLWIGIHSFILLMSYTGIDFFNKGGYYSTSSFWPFVSFISCYLKSWYKPGELIREECEFNGVFTCYDWSEYAFYVGIAIFIYVLMNMSKKTT